MRICSRTGEPIYAEFICHGCCAIIIKDDKIVCVFMEGFTFPYLLPVEILVTACNSTHSSSIAYAHTRAQMHTKFPRIEVNKRAHDNPNTVVQIYSSYFNVHCSTKCKALSKSKKKIRKIWKIRDS